MKVSDLEELFIENGCNPMHYSIGRSGDDCDCIKFVDGYWLICYSERGVDREPIFRSKSEEEAAEKYFEMIMGIRHHHVVCFVKSESRAREVRSQLDKKWIPSVSDRVDSFFQDGSSCYRVFVFGKDKDLAEKLLGPLPIED